MSFNLNHRRIIKGQKHYLSQIDFFRCNNYFQNEHGLKIINTFSKFINYSFYGLVKIKQNQYIAPKFLLL